MDVFVELKAIISDFQAKMAAARGEMAETEDSGSSSFSKLGGLASTGLGAVAVAAVAAGAVMLDLGIKFQDSTAAMAAAGNIPIKTAQQIGQAFLHTGSDTIYTAAQMEQAYGQVAGQLSTLKGFTDTAAEATRFMGVAMDLAEESGSSLTSATSDLAKMMQTYGLNINQAGAASVNMFNASRLTGQSIDSLTQGMTRLHAQMGVATPSIADASALMVDLSEHGETGRQAMSALSSMFSGIIAPTAAVTKAQKELGVTFETANGQLLPMSQIIGELAPKIDGMGTAQATATLKSLGLGTASLKLVSTIEGGTAAFSKASAAVNNTAAAHAALTVQQQTLGHQFDTLKVQMENLATKIGVELIPIVSALLRGFLAFMNFIRSNQDTIELLARILFYVLGGAVIALALNWQKAWQAMKPDTADFVGFFVAIPGELVGFFSNVASGIVGQFEAIPADLYNGVVMPIWNLFAQLPGEIVSLFENVGGNILKTIESSIPGGGIVGKALSVLGLASGGLVTSPTLAVVGEAGPELVVPLAALRGAAIDGSGITRGITAGGSGATSGGGGDLIIQVDGQTFARVAGPAFRQWLNTGPGRNATRITAA